MNVFSELLYFVLTVAHKDQGQRKLSSSHKHIRLNKNTTCSRVTHSGVKYNQTHSELSCDNKHMMAAQTSAGGNDSTMFKPGFSLIGSHIPFGSFEVNKAEDVSLCVRLHNRIGFFLTQHLYSICLMKQLAGPEKHERLTRESRDYSRAAKEKKTPNKPCNPT